MVDVDAGGHAQPLGGEMRQRPARGDTDIELARPLLRERDQLGQRVDAERRAGADHHGWAPTKPIGTKSRATSNGSLASISGSARKFEATAR